MKAKKRVLPFFLVFGCLTPAGCAIPAASPPQETRQVAQTPPASPTPTCYWTSAPAPTPDANGVTPPAPTPYWTCHPRLIETGDRITAPEIRPRFDVEQPESLVDSILADGKPHTITVLFADKYRFRTRYHQGAVRAESQWGLVALNDTDGALAAVESTLSPYRFKWISSTFAYPAGMTPAQMAEETVRLEALADADERELEANAGYDLPNRGSFVTLALADYSPDKAKALIKALNALPFVMTAEVQPTVEVPSTTLISNN